MVTKLEFVPTVHRDFLLALKKHTAREIAKEAGIKYDLLMAFKRRGSSNDELIISLAEWLYKHGYTTHPWARPWDESDPGPTGSDDVIGLLASDLELLAKQLRSALPYDVVAPMLKARIKNHYNSLPVYLEALKNNDKVV